MAKHVHILGVAGTFMAGVAVIAAKLGFRVTGTDSKIYPPMSDILAQEKIEYIEDYNNPDNINYINQADCIIIGNALSRGNFCIEYVLEHKKIFKSGPAWLHENVLQNKWVLAVSGTHGKTTTSSMLAWILDYNKLNPGFLIGGLASNFGTSARGTNSKYFVIEADEYDTAFCDKRPKFLHYFPNTLIINNIEFDHADIYNNLNEIEQQFGYLLRTVPKNNGYVIANDNLKNKFVNGNIYKFGLNKVDLNISYFTVTPGDASGNILTAKLKNTDSSLFDVYYNNSLQGTVSYNLLGDHNVNNSLAALLAAHSVGIDFKDAIAALCKFKGVARRLEKKAELPNGIMIFDDFAHHPTAIYTTLMGLKEKYINNNNHTRLVAILDFSSYSMRTKVHSDQAFIDALVPADVVYFYQDSGMDWDCSVLLNNVKQGFLYKTSADLINGLAENSQPGDIIIFMTKSAFNSNIQVLSEKLRKKVSLHTHIEFNQPS